ncbi:helix-turn-helix transcriptional regulator [Nocardia sp. NPDC051990]|uniref:helix-turn-helix domain-containing protein n=1 Tax=Nocardia sp. NPDC051990 TaxID=3155285 RepID=UPI003444371A
MANLSLANPPHSTSSRTLPDLAPIADQILRETLGLNYIELAQRLQQVGIARRGLDRVALKKIEEGERRVDTDELVALAIALDVSLITLLMPLEAGRHERFVEEITAAQWWEWLRASEPYAAALGERGGRGRLEFALRMPAVMGCR